MSAAATAGAALAGVSGDGQGINPKLLELLIEQQRIISGVEAKRAEVPPPPGFQILAHPQPGPSRPQPVRASSSLLLGAQMGQLSLGPERSLDRVDVLTANQVAIHHHNMEQLRKQQQRDAEAKVV